MNWLTTLGLAVLLLSVQYDSAESRSSILSRSPWANPTKAKSLMNCLMAKIARSKVLPMQEKEDLESIMDTMMSAINGANARGKNSGAQLKAINVAVASSLAEIVVAEDVGNPASIEVKTQALLTYLEQCFRSVMGTVNKKFISEINDLISMFAKEAESEEVAQEQEEDVDAASEEVAEEQGGVDAESEINEEQGQGGFYAAGSSSSSSFQTSQSAETYQSSETFQGSAETASGYRRGYYRPRVPQPIPIGVEPEIAQPEMTEDVPQVSQPATDLPSRVANALVNSSTLRAFLRRGIPQRTAYNLLRRTIQSLANTLGVDKNNLGRIALQTISQLAPGSDTPDYAQALSNILVNSGIINDSNIESVGPRVLSAVLNGLSRAGKSLGINVNNGNAQNDIRSSSGLTTSSSSSRFAQTASSNNRRTASTISGYTGGYPVEQDTATLSGPVALNENSSVGGDPETVLISRVTNALASSSTFRVLLRRGVPPQTASNLIQTTIKSLSKTLRVDGNKLGRIASQAISQLGPGSDTPAYAQAISTALVTGGILNERNIDSKGSRVLSAVLTGLSNAGKTLGINVDPRNVQNDIRSSSGFLAKSSSSTSFSQTTASSTSSAASTTGGYLGGYPLRPDVEDLGNSFAPTVDSSVAPEADPRTGIISRLTNALSNSSTMRALLRSGMPKQIATNLVRRAVQSLANTLGIDGNPLSRIALQDISQLAQGSDTPAYAQSLSTALVVSGILNERNIDSVGPSVLSALLNGLSSAGEGLGMNVDTGSIQNDIQSSNSFLTTSSSSTSFSETAASIDSSAASTTGGYPGGYPLGPDPGSLIGAFAPTADSSVIEDPQAELISRVANALSNSSTMRALLRRGVPKQTATNLVKRAVQSEANTLGVDGNKLGRIALKAISQLPRGSDTPAYAQALSTALVTSGILNKTNIESEGPRVLSALLNGLSSAGEDIGINVENNNVQNDIQSSSASLTTSSSSTSFSETAASSVSSAASLSGNYPLGPDAITLLGPFSQTVDSSMGGPQGRLISRMRNTLSNSSTMRALLRSDVPLQTASDLIQRTLQSLPNTLGVDGNSLERVTMQAISQLGPGSDTSAYAQALSTVLVTSGILNDRNIDSEGPRVLAAVLNGLSSVGQGLGMNVDARNVQNDIQSSSAFLKTSSSSTSFSQTAASTTSSGASINGGYPLVPDAGNLFGPFAPTVDSSFGGPQNGLISRLRNALSNSSTMRALLRSGTPQQTTSNLIERTAQWLSNTFGVDGNNLGRVMLQATSPLGPGADTPAYAQALSTALVTSGILNERNIDSEGPVVLSAVLNGLSNAGQGLGMNVDAGNIQNDIQSSSSFLKTSSSSTSFSETTASTSRSGASITGGYPLGPDTLTLFGPFAPTVDSSFGGPQDGLTSRLRNALLNSSTMRALLRSDVPPQTTSNLIERTAQWLGNTFGLDGNNLGRVMIQATSQLGPDADTPAYAQALSTALVTSGILNDINSDSEGPRVLAAVLNGLSSAGQGLGMNIDAGNVQNDIQSSSSFLKTSSSTSFSQTSASSSSSAASITGGYPLGLDAGNLFGPFAPNVESPIGGGPQAELISRVTNALSNSSTMKSLLRSGVPPQTASNLIQRTVQWLANTLDVDGNNLGRVTAQATSQLGPVSDTPAYAKALSTALVTSGILNERNIDTEGPRVLSAILNGLSSAGQGLGLNVDTGNIQNDIQSSSSFLKTSTSSTSFSQTAASTTSSATSITGGYPLGPDAGNLFGPFIPTPDSSFGGPQDGLISRLSKALSNSSTVRALLKSGVPPQTTSNLIERTAQWLDNTFGVDGNNLGRVMVQAASQLGPGSDTPAYAQALSTALVTSGILNYINIDSEGPRVLAAILNGLSSAGQSLGMNIDAGNVQNDIQSSSSFLKTSSSSTSVSQAATSTISNAASTTGGYSGGYPLGPGIVSFEPFVDSSVGGPQAGVMSRISNALSKSSTMRNLLRSGVPPQTAYNLLQRMVEWLANTLGVDGNNLGRVMVQATSQLGPGTDTPAYAQALSTALVTSGILNDRNIDSEGPRVLAAVLNGLSNAGQGLGMNIDTSNIQNDIQSSTSFLKISSSSTSFSQTAASAISNAASTTGGYSGGYPLGPGIVPFAPTVDSSVGGGPQAGVISRISNALSKSSTMRALLRNGVPPQTASNLIQRTVQWLANTLGVDGNNLGRVTAQATSQLGPVSDTPAYAKALSTALVTSGILNERNIDTEGPRVLSAVLNGLSSAGQGLGMNVDTGNIQNDIQSSSSLLKTSSSSVNFSQTTASTISNAASTTGVYPGGYPPARAIAPFAPGVDSSVGRGSQVGVISRVTNALSKTSTIRALLRSGVPSQTASNLIQRMVQFLANTLGVDGNNLGRVTAQATSQLGPVSDTPAYAQALSTALARSGILNDRNIDSDGPRVLAAVLNGLSSAAKGLGMNVDAGNIQNDIQSSSSLLTTSSSSTSFSQTAASTVSNAASITGGYPGGYPPGPDIGPFAPIVDSSIGAGPQAGIISRVTKALSKSSTMRALLRCGVPPQTATNLIQRTAQSLANTLGVDGNNLGRIALQAVSKLSPGCDTPAYAEALSTALVTSGILNERNTNSVGPRVLSALLNGLASAAQGLGINVDIDNVQNDIRLISDFVTSGVEPFISGQQFDSFADKTSFGQTSEFSSSSIKQTDFSQSSGFVSSATSQGGFRESPGIASIGSRPLPELSVLPTLNSPNGLKSDLAESRIRQTALSILNAISPTGVDANALTRSLQASVSNLKSLGMSPSDAKIEVLLETIVGLLQLLSNSQVRGLNTTTASSVTSSATKSFELALA